MLGYVMAEGQGATDRLIRAVAGQLQRDGVAIAGAIQTNTETAPDAPCQMDLHLLPGGTVIRISQSLGKLSEGCRLDPDGLERAVGLVSAALEDGAGLVIVNKFGKQESEGRGFRPVIAAALTAGVPVLTAVAKTNHAAFLDYAGELAERLPDDADAVADWCRNQAAARV